MIRKNIEIGLLILSNVLAMFGFTVIHLIISVESNTIHLLWFTVDKQFILNFSLIILGLVYIIALGLAIETTKKRLRKFNILIHLISSLMMIIAIIILRIVLISDLEYYYFLGLTLNELTVFDSAIILITIAWIIEDIIVLNNRFSMKK